MLLINPVNCRIYKVDPSAEKHDFRNRLKDRDNSYVLLSTVKGQPYYFKHQELIIREQLGYFTSSGYIILKSADLESLGITPAPDGSNWVLYRLSIELNGSYSTKLLRIVEAKPESPKSGHFLLWYIFFDEVQTSAPLSTLESPTQNLPEVDLTKVVEVIHRHE